MDTAFFRECSARFRTRLKALGDGHPGEQQRIPGEEGRGGTPGYPTVSALNPQAWLPLPVWDRSLSH